MEIVKKIESPTVEEEISFDIEEEPFPWHEEEKDSKKGLFLTLIGLIVMATLGYFGFKHFSAEKKQEVNIHQTPLSVVEPQIEAKAEPKPKVETKIKPIEKTIPKESIKKERVKVITYTEELAQAMKPIKAIKTNETIKPIETIKEIKIKTPIQSVQIIEETPKIVKVPKKIPEKMKIYTETRKTRIVTIRKGDTLNKLSEKFYGSSSEFKRIIAANKRIRSSKTALKYGQKVVIPYKKAERKRRFIIVKKGYSLAYISKKVYGTKDKIKKIIHANSRIKSGRSTLRIGQKVYVPK